MTRREDGRWQDKLPYKDQNGKTKYKYFYGKTQADVRKQMREWQPDAPKPVTFADILDEWHAQKIETVSYKTAEGYEAPMRRVKEQFGNSAPGNITPAQIQALINSLAKQGYTRSVVQRPLDIMRMAFDYAILQGYATNNPCAAVSVPSGVTQQRRDLASPADIEIVKNSLDAPFGLFAFLLVYSGLRKGEALALTDKDFTESSIIVNKALSWQPNQPVIKMPKTKAGIRTVPLLEPLKKALPKWKGYLFSADGGETPLTQIQFRHRWDDYCHTAGLADCEIVQHRSSKANNQTYQKTVWTNRIVPHQLRHEFTTLCYDAGLEAKDTQEILGHAKLETTMSIYTHIRQSRREKTAEKLNSFVANIE